MWGVRTKVIPIVVGALGTIPLRLKENLRTITDFWGQQGSSACKESTVRSPGLVDFAIGLVNSVFNLPDGLVMFYEEFE